MRATKVAFCPTCNADRPVVKLKVPAGIRTGGEPIGLSRAVSCCAVCRNRVYPKLKHGNVPTLSKHSGRVFQSKREAAREPELIALQNVGAIKDLKYQERFRLEVYSTQAVEALVEAVENCANLDALALADDALVSAFKSGQLMALARLVRLAKHNVCDYLADFTYTDDRGNRVVEDPKGRPNDPVYRLKKKLMLACHGVEIVEPQPGGVQQRARGAGIRGRGTGSRLTGGR